MGNYFNLRDLPDELGPNNVLQALKEKMEKTEILNQLAAQNKKQYTALSNGGGVFQKFEWMPDNYNSCM